jgi:hypothetical protein
MTFTRKVPHQAIRALSSERLPTLCKYLITFERFLVVWEKVRDDPNHPHLRPFTEVGLDWAGKYYERMGDSKAYVIAMGMFVPWV